MTIRKPLEKQDIQVVHGPATALVQTLRVANK